jgi:hypothetical protein
LAYLAAQIKQNTKSNLTTALQTVNAQNAGWLSLLSQPNGLAKLFYFDTSNGLAGLSEDDLARYISTMIHMGRIYETQYELYKNGVIPDEIWESSLRSLGTILRQNGAREWWSISPEIFTDSFQKLVNEILAQKEDV